MIFGPVPGAGGSTEGARAGFSPSSGFAGGAAAAASVGGGAASLAGA